MARIRSIKPEFFTSEQVVECSTNARLLFVGMWCWCDDYGIHPASAKRLKMEVFPGDNFSNDQIEEMLLELLSVGLLKKYRVGDGWFFAVTGWRHQKIDKRQDPKYPGIEEAEEVVSFDDHSTTIPRMVDDHSRRIGREGIGEDGNGEEKEEEEEEEEGKGDPPSKFVFPVVSQPGKPHEWALPEAKLAEYRETFSALDVEQEILAARQWVRDNPANRKTASGMKRFLTNWLARSQNNGRGPRKPTREQDMDAFVAETNRELERIRCQKEKRQNLASN